MPECLSILQSSDCGEAGATGAAGGGQVKTITIRLTDVEAAMLSELLKKTGKPYAFCEWFAAAISKAYSSLGK